jgi:hypothetical protein
VFLIGRIASIAALLWQPNSQPGQTESQAADPIRFSVLEYAISNLARTSTAVFDRMQFPEGPSHESQGRPHDDAFLARVIQTPGMRVATRTEVFRCAAKAPSSCRLIGTDTFISLSNPVVNDERATVTLYYEYNTASKRRPVENVVYDVTLSFVAGRWQVVQLKKLSES